MQNLSSTQREILLALVELYNKGKKMIKSKEVADMIGKDEGTVRNIILGLKVLGLVESKPGPNGGYIPTLKAYEFIKNPSISPILDKLSLYRGNVETDIRPGDPVRLGPTPYSRLVIDGVVINADDSRKEVLIDVKRMISVPKEKVKNIIGRRLITLKPDMTLKEASMILYKEGIRGAPVLGEGEKVLGIITTADIIKAFFEGKYDAKVSDYMKTDVITIRDEEDVLEAIRKMVIYNVGRLLVVDSMQRVIGIVTRTDILKSIAGLELLWGV
jgi:predicted transcriptional regulator